MPTLLQRAGVTAYNRPRLTPDHPTKKAIVVAKDGDTIKLIRFGAQGYPHNYSDAARRAFKARHAKNIARGKLSAAYWADRFLWKKGGHVKKKKKKRNKDLIPGGLASGRKPSDFPAAALRKGVKVELEHVVRKGRKPTARDRAIALEITMDHLAEDIRYYDFHKVMEQIMDMTKRNRSMTVVEKNVLGLIREAARKGLPLTSIDFLHRAKLRTALHKLMVEGKVIELKDGSYHPAGKRNGKVTDAIKRTFQRAKAAVAKHKAKTKTKWVNVRTVQGKAQLDAFVLQHVGSVTKDPYDYNIWPIVTAAEKAHLDVDAIDVRRSLGRLAKKRNFKKLVRIKATHSGLLGGPGYLKLSAEKRRKRLAKCVSESGYRSCLGGIQAMLVRGKRTLSAADKSKLSADRSWLVTHYGAGSKQREKQLLERYRKEGKTVKEAKSAVKRWASPSKKTAKKRNKTTPLNSGKPRWRRNNKKTPRKRNIGIVIPAFAKAKKGVASRSVSEIKRNFWNLKEPF